MKTLLLILTISLFSCSKDKPAPVDNSLITDYINIVSKSIKINLPFYTGTLNLSVKNSSLIQSIYFKKEVNLTGVQSWSLNNVDGIQGKTFTDSHDIFNGENPYTLQVKLKSGKLFIQTIYFY